jgi:hypothetical protein
MRGAFGLMAAVPLMFVSMSQGAVPLGTTDLHGHWQMRGVVVHSRGGTPTGTKSRRTWTLRLSCGGACHVRATINLDGHHRKVIRLARAGVGNSYRGSLTTAISCAAGKHTNAAPGTLVTKVSLRVTAAKLFHASLVATRVVSYVTTRRECPNRTTSTMWRYRGVPAGAP